MFLEAVKDTVRCREISQHATPKIAELGTT